MAEDQIYRGQSPAEFGLWRRRAKDGVMLFSVPVQGETWQESSQQNLDGLIPLVDRVTVAPDRNTLARVSWTYPDGTVCMLSSRAIDALLESGVLGVPADQRPAVLHVSTAPDMEVRAELFNEGYEAAMSQHLADDPSAAEDWLAHHDDQVRAETLEAAADARQESGANSVAAWLRTRAAEYRKAASA